MRAVEYKFEHRKTRGALWAALGASAGFLIAGGLTANVPLIAAAAGLPLPFLIWSLLFDPRSGLELAAGHLHWWRAGEEREVALAQIRRAALLSEGGGRRRVLLDLADGRALSLPEEVVPPGGALLAALAARGVDVARSA
jgi:hypothetical protein